uniref:Peptidase metallopeptidase domain-containing protein n=1 Tax=Strix occidentalis caurina TaxID=311401 RepID=A0A8D0FFI6_STROC
LGLREDLRVWLGSLLAAPLHPPTTQLCQLSLGLSSHLLNSLGSMVSFGLEAEQWEEKNIPEKIYKLPRACCAMYLPSRYWHGDNLPFDGPGGILAHAFFPKTHREGDVHFDYDETWTIGNNLGTDLLQVAAHEFGHVLGLQHTAVSKSLMSPFYIFRYPLSLSEDDKQGIQYLYGKPKLDPDPTPPQPAELPQGFPRPDACDTAFDAASTIRGELFFFKSRYVWRLRAGKLQDGYPALASRHWQGIPSSVDATFEDPLGNIWFFQGKSWTGIRRLGNRRVSGPTPLVELGLPASPVQAALVWGAEKNKIYIFSGGNYWRFNPHTRQVDNIYPRTMADWRGVPQEIDAAFQDEFGQCSRAMAGSRVGARADSTAQSSQAPCDRPCSGPRCSLPSRDQVTT